MNVLVERVRSRLHKQNKNWLACIVGEPGSGKSLTALKLATLIDDNFTIKNVCFSPEGFMELINSNLAPGSCVIFDEAGCGMPAREFYEISNKMLGYVLQSSRHLRLAFIFTVPSIKFLDSQARVLFHSLLETKHVDFKNNRCLLAWYDIQHSGRHGKDFYKYPRIMVDGMIKKIDTVRVAKPPQNLIDAYEAKRAVFSDSLRAEALRLIKDANRAKADGNLDEVIQAVRDNLDDFKKPYGKGWILDEGKLMNRFNIGESRVKRVRAGVEGSKEVG